jgi:hypothetical protein
VDVHHPQTAAAALAQMEKVQQKNKTLYRFPFTPERTLSIHTNSRTRKSFLPQYHQHPNNLVAVATQPPNTTTHY